MINNKTKMKKKKNNNLIMNMCIYTYIKITVDSI